MNDEFLNQTAPIDFYKILEVDRSANNDTIKRAYRKMALKYHPDKTGGDPSAAEQFQLCAKAHDTLLDPRKRKVYDRYGSKGVEMVEKMGELAPFIDPDIILKIDWFFFGSTLLVACLIIYAAFVSVRADQIITWRWATVFVPIFIVDATLFILVSRLSLPGSQTSDDADSNQTQNDNASTANKKSSTASKVQKLAILTYVSLFILFQIFIVLELDHSVVWSWATVFIPYYCLEFINFIIVTSLIVAEVKMGKTTFMSDGQQQTSMSESFSVYESTRVILHGYTSWMFRIAQMVVFILKLDGAIQTSWAVVFVPFYLEGFYKMGTIVVEYINVKRITRLNPTLDIQTGVVFKIISFVLFSGLFYLGLGLLVSRLDGMVGYPSTAVILIPVFIVLSFLFCCVCCCLPCLVKQARNAVEQELMGDGNGVVLRQIVPVDHRIE